MVPKKKKSSTKDTKKHEGRNARRCGIGETARRKAGEQKAISPRFSISRFLRFFCLSSCFFVSFVDKTIFFESIISKPKLFRIITSQAPRAHLSPVRYAIFPPACA